MGPPYPGRTPSPARSWGLEALHFPPADIDYFSTGTAVNRNVLSPFMNCRTLDGDFPPATLLTWDTDKAFE